MKKFLIHGIPLMVTVGLIIVRIPPVAKKLDDVILGTIVYGILVICTLINYKLTTIAPYKKLEKLKEKSWPKLDPPGDKFLEHYAEYKLSMNIMVAETQLFYAIEPSLIPNLLRLRLWGKVFDVVWQRGPNRVPPGFRLTVNQGNCGACYKGTHKFSSTVLTPETIKNFKLSKKQQKKVDDLTIVVSYRIEIDVPKGNKRKPVTLGILNVESREEAAKILISDTEKQQELYTHMQNFGTVCAELWIVL
jgi:hypothetical protein